MPIALVIGLSVGALLLEATARWILDDGMDFDVEMWRYARDLKRVSDNPEIGHEHRPGASGRYMGVPVSINSTGQRDRDFSMQKATNVTRILMLGDSVTFGWGVRAEHTPSKLVESLLNSEPSPKQIEVVNTGVGNYNTAMEVSYFLDKGHQFSPDIVVLNYFINDAEPTPRRKSFVMEFSQAYVRLASAMDKFSRSFLGGATWLDYYRDLYRAEQPGWIETQKAVERLVDFCRSRDIKLLLVNYPELHETRDYPFSDVTKAVGGIAGKQSIPFLDLTPTVADLEPTSLWVTPTDAHPNKTANERYAEAIASKLRTDFDILPERSAASYQPSDAGTQATK